MAALSAEEKQVEADLKQKMMIIPNIIDPSVPIGKDDSENVEVERLASQLFRTLRFRITLILWSLSTVLIWTVQEK